MRYVFIDTYVAKVFNNAPKIEIADKKANISKGFLMCAERIQRVLMAIMLGVVIVLINLSLTIVAMVLQGFIIVMIIVWAFTDFCPSLWTFKKMFGSCDFDKKKQ